MNVTSIKFTNKNIKPPTTTTTRSFSHRPTTRLQIDVWVTGEQLGMGLGELGWGHPHVGSDHMRMRHCEQTDRQTILKTLPSRKLMRWQQQRQQCGR